MTDVQINQAAHMTALQTTYSASSTILSLNWLKTYATQLLQTQRKRYFIPAMKRRAWQGQAHKHRTALGEVTLTTDWVVKTSPHITSQRGSAQGTHIGGRKWTAQHKGITLQPSEGGKIVAATLLGPSLPVKGRACWWRRCSFGLNPQLMPASFALDTSKHGHLLGLRIPPSKLASLKPI
eukprot:1155075-Pelagomonas_calceolata.AAC.2